MLRQRGQAAKRGRACLSWAEAEGLAEGAIEAADIGKAPGPRDARQPYIGVLWRGAPHEPNRFGRLLLIRWYIPLGLLHVGPRISC
jgi:hypothetical protein